MKKRLFLLLIGFAASCHHVEAPDTLAFIQIQDRNNLTETISNPDRLNAYTSIDFLSSQPYKKVLRVYKGGGKNSSRITTYHPNGQIYQYLEAEEMRAHGAYREWFPNGQLKIESTVIGGTADLAMGAQRDWVFDAVNRVFDEEGHLLALIPYEKGVIQGTSLYYYPTGQIEKEIEFQKGKIDGALTEYWRGGMLKAKTVYKKGLKEGESLGYFEDGNLSWLEDHSDDRLRTGYYYNPQGELIAKVEKGAGFAAQYDQEGLSLIEYRIGLPDGLVRKLTPNGELKRSFYLKSGMKHGEEVEYFLSSEWEGAPDHPKYKLSIYWVENRIHGCVKTWYNQGQLHSQREYLRNQRVGPSLAWYLDGSLMLYEEYEEDRLLTGQYYKLQKKEPISSVAKGTGIATLFDERGSFLRKVNYVKGKPVDPED
jgi:antitoxin component YwqK of YwqJK toxin-antitoxin module